MPNALRSRAALHDAGDEQRGLTPAASQKGEPPPASSSGVLGDRGPDPSVPDTTLGVAPPCLPRHASGTRGLPLIQAAQVPGSGAAPNKPSEMLIALHRAFDEPVGDQGLAPHRRVQIILAVSALMWTGIILAI